MSFNLKYKNRVSLRVFLIEIFLIKVVSEAFLEE